MANPKLLVDPQELRARVREGAVLLDARAPMRYREGHLPGAINLPVQDLFEVAGSVRRRRPREQLIGILERLGVSRERPVIVYGAREGLEATNLFWVLECLGHTTVALLDGGVERWVREGLEMTQERPTLKPARWGTSSRETSRTEPCVSGEWLLAHLEDPGVQIVDTRAPEEYTGEACYARRGGHIPGALLLPYDRVMRPEGAFRSAEEIRALHETLGLSPTRTTVSYCQIAARAAHVYFAQRLAGFRDPRVYEASWAEWGNDERFPVER